MIKIDIEMPNRRVARWRDTCQVHPAAARDFAGRPFSGRDVPRSGIAGFVTMRLRHDPYDEWLYGVRDAFAYGLCRLRDYASTPRRPHAQAPRLSRTTSLASLSGLAAIEALNIGTFRAIRGEFLRATHDPAAVMHTVSPDLVLGDYDKV